MTRDIIIYLMIFALGLIIGYLFGLEYEPIRGVRG